MAGGPAPSQETGLRRAVRLALGTAVVFVAAQLLAWPLAQLAPAFAVILLLDPDVINVRQALGILATTIIAFVSGYLLAVMLLPYPAVLLVLHFCHQLRRTSPCYCRNADRLYLYPGCD